jgi:hypothetical protein
MKTIVLSALAATIALGALSAPASAAVVPVPDPSTCSLAAVSGAIDCVGYYSGNIFSSSADNKGTQLLALQDLGFVGTPDWTAIYAANSGYKVSPLNGASSVSFAAAPLLFGTTYFGIHWGGNQSAVYKLNFEAPTSMVSFLGQNPGGSSNAVLFSTQAPVPEAATWAMMIAGMGVVGASMRRRKAAISFA